MQNDDSHVTHEYDLQPLILDDDMIYHHFEVKQFERGTHFKYSLSAYTEDSTKIMLPITIKNLYQTREAVNDVYHIVERLFTGKTREECEEMLKIKHYGDE